MTPKLKVVGTDGAYAPFRPSVDLSDDGFHLTKSEVEVVRLVCQGIKFQDACHFARVFDQAVQESLYDKVERLGLN